MHSRMESSVPAKTKRERAIATPNAGVGLTRYQLYKKAWARILTAAEAGYCLEAITLLECILTDRLESRTGHLTGQNEGYQNLGPLIGTWRKHENVEDFRPIINEVDAWRKRRNRAVHEMVKFESGEHPTWEEKLDPLSEIVREGKRVLRAFDAIDKRERRKNGVRPAATEPAAFAVGHS